MKLLNIIPKKILSRTVCMVLSAVCFSCTDELVINHDSSVENDPLVKIDMENSLMVPIAINMGTIGVSTRDPETLADLPDDLESGTTGERIIDFREKDSFALFFDDNGKFMYLKTLYQNSSLGSGSDPKDGVGEFSVYAVAYLDKPEGWEFNKTLDDFKGQTDPQAALDAAQREHEQKRLEYLPSKILVVLNGGRIYKDFCSTYKIDPNTGETETGKNPASTEDILQYVWKYNVGIEDNDESNENGETGENESDSKFNNRMRFIGSNDDGHFTMTNSAYYGPDETAEDAVDHPEKYPTATGTYKLQTVRPINRSKIITAIASNLTQANCAAKIYVERMVAKFSAPQFPTEVIGSNKVFRPSGDAQPVVIYSYNKNNKLWVSEETNWRIHVLGWTINGREKENYLFKNIKEPYEDNSLKDWDKGSWNDPAHRRSYWSRDPHYTYQGNNTQTGDFYPWQYRAAMDKKGISWVVQDGEDMENNNIPLRYFTFDEVRYWDDKAITISENTFDPYYNEEFINENSNGELDGRGTLLMGPHLLVTAELYLETEESEDNDYIGQFNKVPDLYCDRYFRYFQSEEDMFRMFVKDMNDALRTQSSMSFSNYEWNDKVVGDNHADRYTVIPKGKCQLFFDCTLDPVDMTPEEQATYSKLCGYDVTHGKNEESGKKSKYHLQEVSSMIDELVKDKIPLSIAAPVKDGDGRVLPWVPGMVYRNIDNPKDILEIQDASGNSLSKWDDHLRKSIIFEWIGVIDHFKNGFMYYAADIPHHINSETKRGYYGAVRNHWYTFTVKSINSLGTPVSDINQRIIPNKYKYRDQISVYVEPLPWHFINTVYIPFGGQ